MPWVLDGQTMPADWVATNKGGTWYGPDGANLTGHNLSYVNVGTDIASGPGTFDWSNSPTTTDAATLLLWWAQGYATTGQSAQSIYSGDAVIPKGDGSRVPDNKQPALFLAATQAGILPITLDGARTFLAWVSGNADAGTAAKLDQVKYTLEGVAGYSKDNPPPPGSPVDAFYAAGFTAADLTYTTGVGWELKAQFAAANPNLGPTPPDAMGEAPQTFPSGPAPMPGTAPNSPAPAVPMIDFGIPGGELPTTVQDALKTALVDQVPSPNTASSPAAGPQSPGTGAQAVVAASAPSTPPSGPPLGIPWAIWALAGVGYYFAVKGGKGGK